MMNLQALYDLKERLEHAAIAGTSLLQEDFRLRRAAEVLAPLAKANPVFAKISGGVTALLNAPETHRSTKLLDVLSLVDAVVYTQGITGISGEMIPAERGAGRYVQISYGELQPLLAALKGSGSGRTALIRENWIQHPEYFSDFRVLPSVVGALGDNYGELADLIAEILMKQGQSVIPLLKENFDPAGKTEMARRVRLIAKLAGERENDWFVSILPDSKKDVREAVIQALSLSNENNQLLLDLCQSERGKLKDAAMRSLAGMRDDRCVEFLRGEVKKKGQTAWHLSGASAVWAADITAFAVRMFLTQLKEGTLEFDQTRQEHMIKYCEALMGKYSEDVRLLWLWICENMDAFSKIRSKNAVQGWELCAADYLHRCWLGSLLSNTSAQMLDLARELYSLKPTQFLYGQFFCDLQRESPEYVYDHYAMHIIHENLLVRENQLQKQRRIQLMKVLFFVKWEQVPQRYVYHSWDADALTGEFRSVEHVLTGLDRRWMEHLANHNISQDCRVYVFRPNMYLTVAQTSVEQILMQLINPGDETMCGICGAYFYRRIKMTGQLSDYLDILKKCGWEDWSGLLTHCVQKQNQVRLYQVLEELKRLPMSNQEKAIELRRLDEMVKAGRISVWNRIWPEDQIGMLILHLESDPNAEL